MTQRKRTKHIIIVLSILLVVGGILTQFVLPRLIVNTGNSANAVYLQLKGINTLPNNIPPPDSACITSKDGLQLHGLIFKADSARGTLLFLHGIRASKEAYLPFLDQFREWNYNVVLIDHRAHGQSDGTYCTFGFREKEDVRLWVDYLLEKGLHRNIGVWGQSLGGAIALQALAHDTRLEFGIVESTFANFREVTQHYIDLTIPIFPTFFKNHLINRAGSIAQFPPDAIQPEKSALSITVPLFMAHGENDKNIVPEHGRRIYKNVPSSNKSFHLIEGAGHSNLWATGGQDYFDAVGSFLSEL